jgi:MFS family permease
MRDEGGTTANVVPSRLITPTFLGVMAAAFAFFMYVGVLVPIIPTFVEDEMRGGELGIGLAIASFAGAAIVVRPLIGRLIERYGRRAVMVGGGLLAAAAGVMYGYVDSLPLLLVLRAVSGVGEAALFVGAATLVADLSPHHRRAEGASYFSVAVYAGIGIGPVIGEAVLDSHGLRPAFTIAAGFAAVAAAVSLTLPARVTPGGPTGDVVPPAGGPDGTIVIDIDPSRRSPFVHRAALGPGVLLAIGMAAFAVFPAFLPDYARSLGLSGSGGLFAVYSAVCLVLRVVGAKLPERLGPRTSVTFAFCLLGIALALLAAVAEQWALWTAAVLIGTGVAFMYPSLMALTVARAPDHERPRAISSFTMFFEVGTGLGGLALGALADSFGKRSAFATAVALCGVGLWVLWTRVLPREAHATAVRPASPQSRLVAVGGD